MRRISEFVKVLLRPRLCGEYYARKEEMVAQLGFLCVGGMEEGRRLVELLEREARTEAQTTPYSARALLENKYQSEYLRRSKGD